MSVFEMVLAAATVVGVVSAWHVAVRRPEFIAAIDAWAKRLSRENEQALTEAWAEGHQAGQEFERLRGSKPTIAP